MSIVGKEDYYIFNPGYQMRKEKKRVVIFKKNRFDNDLSNVVCFIHPLIAILISMFDGRTETSKIINDFSHMTSLKKTAIKKTLNKFLLNNKICFLNFDSFRSSIPDDTIIPANGLTRNPVQAKEDFLIPHAELDCKSRRLDAPLDLLFEINFNCLTNCVYCYADRSKKYQPLPLNRILELVREARKLGMRNFDFNGGELFLNENWECILRGLIESDYHPYISTKVPITRKIMMKLKNIGIDSIQISLDTVIPDEMKQILNVDDQYCRDILACLDNLAQLGFKININSQITRYNENSVEDLIKYLLNYHDHIKRIRIGAAGFSLYKGADSYLSFRPSLESFKKIEKTIKYYNDTAKDKIISMSEYLTSEQMLSPLEKKTNHFKKRASCSANFSSLVVLPDGKVTICEELYWHPQFIIGDLAVQSIEEVWNSKRALELYRFSKVEMRGESVCMNCPDSDFTSCHEVKGVCWKDILRAYGSDNWDFPDPKCPMAPPPIYKYWNE